MEPLVSVIVPVYNTEKYLRRCIDSIINQACNNLQIILVDDGSTDNSGAICDEYARKDARIIVIHQQNGGSVIARNAGIKGAKGEWIAFVDSDDWIASQMLSVLMDKASQADYDMIWFDIISKYSNHSITERVRFNNNPSTMLSSMLKGHILVGCIWSKIIRRSFLDSCELKMFDHDNMFEDLLLTTELLLHHPKIGHVPVSLYYYNHTNDSSQTAVSEGKSTLRGINNIRHMADYIIDNGSWDKYKDNMALLLMTAKVALLKNGNIKQALSFFPYAHRKLSYYRMNTLLAVIYWIGFNCGFIGEIIIKIYLRLRQGNRLLRHSCFDKSDL